MEEPLVSVIIPCYNAADYVEDALRSVGNQTYSNIEIICVNDGSTDLSGELINSFMSKYDGEMQVHTTENRGGSAARNVGLKHATGEYIQFLDADDILRENKIEEQMTVLLESDDDAVLSDYQMWSNDLLTLLEIRRFANFSLNPLYAAITGVISTQNPIYKKSILEKHGGYEEKLPAAQDWELNLRLVLEGVKFCYHPGFLSQARKVTGSVSSNWLKVSALQCKILTRNRERIMADERYNLGVQDSIKRVYFNTLVHRSDSPGEGSLYEEMQKWNHGGTGFVPGAIKRMFARLFGVPQTITVARKFKKK